MKKIITFLTVLLYITALWAVTYVLDQSYTLYDASFYLQVRPTTGVLWQATSFTPSVTGILGKITLRVAKAGAPSGNVWIEIHADNSNKPNESAILVQSDNVNPAGFSTLLTTGAEQDFIFSTQYSLTANTKYWMVFNGDYAISTVNWAAGFIKNNASATFGYRSATDFVIPYATNANGYFLEYYYVPSTARHNTAKPFYFGFGRN